MEGFLDSLSSAQKTCGRFKIESKIAEGAFGTVYKGTHLDTKQQVALKELFFGSNAKTKGIIDREISILNELKGQKNVVEIISVEMTSTKCSLAMEFMDYDLKQFIENANYPLSQRKIKRIARDILVGLQSIHSKNIIHRDLKPSNILLSKNWEVKIGDFGSAIREDAKKEGCFSIEGFTRWYKSPEQLFGSRNYSHEVDIWSFACIFFELIAGFPLFPGNTEIEQISRIADLLGDPSPENWPSIVNMPDFGKILFKQKQKKEIREQIQQASELEVQFLLDMLKYDNRPTAEQVKVY